MMVGAKIWPLACRCNCNEKKLSLHTYHAFIAQLSRIRCGTSPRWVSKSHVWVNIHNKTNNETTYERISFRISNLLPITLCASNFTMLLRLGSAKERSTSKSVLLETSMCLYSRALAQLARVFSLFERHSPVFVTSIHTTSIPKRSCKKPWTVFKSKQCWSRRRKRHSEWHRWNSQAVIKPSTNIPEYLELDSWNRLKPHALNRSIVGQIMCRGHACDFQIELWLPCRTVLHQRQK